MRRLNIYDRRERALVRTADALLAPAGAVRRLLRPRRAAAPARILCLRLERIGDLLMTLPALATIRDAAPGARIDLVVGSWNREIAEACASVNAVETLDAAWLARGASATGLGGLLRRAAAWRSRHYDLAVNFEPDIRTNLALALSGAARTAGFASAGGGALLDLALDFDTRAHTTANALMLAAAAVGAAAPRRDRPMLALPEASRREAERLLAPAPRRPLVAMHVSSGRLVKQWPEDRFAEVAHTLVRDRHATIVLTGAESDRAQVTRVRDTLPADAVADVTGLDLLGLSALLARVDLLITCDTGPMHLARAVGTPIVAIFGPSDPVRYGPDGVRDRVVRVDLPCSPCNRIRKPPSRCAGRIPDCLTSIDTARVLAAVDDVLREGAGATPLAGVRPA